MHVPVHVAAAACVCQVTLYADSLSHTGTNSKTHTVIVGAFCFLGSLYSHLFLDIVPHYNILYNIWIEGIPFLPKRAWTLLNVGILTVPVLFMMFHYTRDHLLIALVSLVGGVYPDIEKTAYFLSYLPRRFVIFRSHSCYYSPVAWETEHKYILIFAELVLFIALIVSIPWFARRRKSQACVKQSNPDRGWNPVRGI